MRNRPMYDLVALLARCGVGTVFLAHGWQKIQVGVTATGRNLDTMGAPFPTASAVFSTFVELLGGAALILGLALPVAGALLFVDMTGALIFVHAQHGVFLVDRGNVHNGFELVLVLGLASLLFAIGGGGRLALDSRLFGRDRDAEPDDPPWRERPVTAPSERPPAPVEERAEPARPSGKTRPGRSGPPAARPRPVEELVTDTSRDVVVAGKKSESDDTTATKPRKRPKS